VNDVNINYMVGDKEFYTPLSEIRDGVPLAPAAMPGAWSCTRWDVWALWQEPGVTHIVEDGWKVHVSARPDRLQEVLDTVAGVCVEQTIPFKHLSTQRFFDLVHHKFASRSQSGKVVAAYPPDIPAARRLMERLREELADEQGPAVLTDRPFQGSKTVFYRYGAYIPRPRVNADGTRTLLVRDGTGRLVPDLRASSFRLPDAITDPFAAPRTARESASGAGSAAKAPDTTEFFNGFAIKNSVRYTNAGGTYRGVETATGRRVFVKEARPHNGIGDGDLIAAEQVRREWRILTDLHGLAPGLAPQPLSYFRVCDHDYLVMEHVEGIVLSNWLALNHPLLSIDTTESDFAAYYERCERIIGALESQLEHLHGHGYAFVDVSPGNVLVGPDDSVRLVDFGAAHRIGDDGFIRTGTHGFAAPEQLIGDDVTVCDRYGACAMSLFLLAPLNQVAEKHPGALAHLHHDLSERAPVPPALWERATRFHAVDEGCEPTPEQVSADPAGRLRILREQIADALIAVARVEQPGRVFPTIPQGFETNTVCLAYGTAGVVHALRRAGRELPSGLLDRLRRDALDDGAGLGPGLYVGTAGAAAVLAESGLPDEARILLDKADSHPLAGECATLFGGAAGVAMAHLVVYGRTGDEYHVERALALAESLPADEALTPALGKDDATGLLHGRCGIALMLQQLAGVTGDDRLLARAVRLLHAELDRAVDPGGSALQFPVSRADKRVMPYLYCGSAGMLFAVSRCLRATADERLAEALPRLKAAAGLTYTIMPGLFQGTSGLAFALADHAALHEDEPARRAALTTARGLFKFAIPHPTGARVLGDQLLRYSAELWSGSAGVLLALDHVLDPRPDVLFTVDALIDGRRKAR
jgi:hypothetical protein